MFICAAMGSEIPSMFVFFVSNKGQNLFLHVPLVLGVQIW